MGGLTTVKSLIATFTAASLTFATMTQTHAEESPQYLTVQSLVGWKDYGGIFGVNVVQGQTFDMTVNPRGADAYRISVPSEYINSVTPHGPADYAGIRAGDEILFIDHKYFENVETLVTYIAGQSPGHVADVAVARNGKLLTASIPLASVKHPHAPAYDNPSSGALGTAVSVGVVAVLGCWLLGCFSGGSSSSSGSAGSSNASNDWEYRHIPAPSSEEPARPDTSAGCAWGDRAYGTCH